MLFTAFKSVSLIAIFNVRMDDIDHTFNISMGYLKSGQNDEKRSDSSSSAAKMKRLI
jgi:hypothetical protein